MATCEGTVPEATVMQEQDGEVWTEFTPAHPCEAEATMLSRSMREVVTAETTREDGSTAQMLAWERVADHFYCGAHFVPGAMTHVDGRVTQHPAMAVSDA